MDILERRVSMKDGALARGDSRFKR
jgi:hypothetical protein